MTRKTCSHCDRSFTPNTNADGVVEYTDALGNVCCDICYCGVCGHGHPTADEHDLCQSGAEDDEPAEGPDPDLFRDIALDGLLGV